MVFDSLRIKRRAKHRVLVARSNGLKNWEFTQVRRCGRAAKTHEKPAGTVAQWLEQGTHNPLVRCSNHLGPIPILKSTRVSIPSSWYR